MTLLENALSRLTACENKHLQRRRCDARMLLVTVFIYLAIILSVSPSDPALLLWFAIFPIVMAEAEGLGFGRIFLRSLKIIPFLFLIGIFNPIFDKETVAHIGHYTVNRGVMTFVSLLLRGLLSFQVLLILIGSAGFFDVCRALRYFRVPSILVGQLMLLYRYMGVLIAEALTMRRAREARGYARKSYPLRMWTTFTGQLFIRSFDRASRICKAMQARGFDGEFRFAPYKAKVNLSDWLLPAGWTTILLCLRFFDINSLLADFIHI